MEIVYQLSEKEIGEAKQKSIREVAQMYADALRIPLQEVMKALENMAYSTPFNIEEMKEATQKLIELAEQAKNECADYIIETEIENGWPLHPNKCRAGCTSKPIAKPPYWHRIRSYCVTTKYH